MPLLSQVVLPIGPLPARLEAGGHLRVRVDALGLWVLGAGLLESRLRLDIGRSLADGVMLWVADSGRLGSQSSLGEALPWAAAINRETLEGDRGPNVRAHERVHVVQFDVVTFVFSDAIDRWALHRLPFLQPLARGVALNLGTLGYWYAQGMVASAVAWRDRPWEVEATTLAGEYQ